jgi:hypothetical protein
LPAVSLYKIGEHYFVRDGNHRVSVARFHGAAAIDAEVVEIRGRMRTNDAQPEAGPVALRGGATCMMALALNSTGSTSRPEHSGA